MVEEIATVINSIGTHINKRMIEGVKPSNDLLYYRLIAYLKDYCDSRSEVVYSTYKKLLNDKLVKMRIKSKDIMYKPVKYINTITAIDLSVDDDVIDTSKLVLLSKSNVLISRITLESEDCLLNGKSRITVNAGDCVSVEHKFLYFPISSDKSVKISKMAYNAVFSIGYRLLDYSSNKLLFSNSVNEMHLSATEINNSDINETVFYDLEGYIGGVGHLSNTAKIFISHELESDDIDDVIDKTVSYNIDKPNDTRTPSHLNIKLYPTGIDLDIPNLYRIENVSRFLMYNNKTKMVSISSDYKVEMYGDYLIAIPVGVYDLLNNGYLIKDTSERFITLTKILDNGNSSDYTFNVFIINDSLYMSYRVIDDGIISDKASIKFSYVLPSINADEREKDNVIFV